MFTRTRGNPLQFVIYLTDSPSFISCLIIQRQTSGRKGKGVCLITGVDLDDAELTKLAAELKKKCGCGGAVKDGIIEIQGDKRDLLKSMLEAKGMKVKLAGG